MQIACTSRYDLNLVTVVQYPDCAGPNYIENFTIPLQQKQLADITRVSTTTKQHGGFYFSCYLGSYFNENYATTYPLTVPHLAQEDGVWKQIEVGGVSMHDAIAGWWNDTSAAEQLRPEQKHWYMDTVWNATQQIIQPVYAHSNCDPGAKGTCEPGELCIGAPVKTVCPKSGICPSNAHQPSGKPTGGHHTPMVPWWTNRMFTNPTCRGYPWY
jgi:hypothetical protein